MSSSRLASSTMLYQGSINLEVCASTREVEIGQDTCAHLHLNLYLNESTRTSNPVKARWGVQAATLQLEHRDVPVLQTNHNTGIRVGPRREKTGTGWLPVFLFLLFLNPTSLRCLALLLTLPVAGSTGLRFDIQKTARLLYPDLIGNNLQETQHSDDTSLPVPPSAIAMLTPEIISALFGYTRPDSQAHAHVRIESPLNVSRVSRSWRQRQSQPRLCGLSFAFMVNLHEIPRRTESGKFTSSNLLLGAFR